nr:MAG TPA: hypothetical protein [Caudoviricetes sp.]
MRPCALGDKSYYAGKTPCTEPEKRVLPMLCP